MKSVKKILLVALAFVLAASAFAALAEDSGKVVATYKGGQVTYGEAEERINCDLNYMQSQMNSYMYYMGGGSFTFTAEQIAALRQDSIYQIAQEKILMAKMVEMGIPDFTKEELAAIMEKAEQSYSQNVSFYVQMGYSAEQAANNLTMSGTTVQYIYEQLLTSNVQERIMNALAIDETVSEEALAERYAELVEKAETQYTKSPVALETYTNNGNTTYYMPEGFKYVKHIIIIPEAEIAAYNKLLSTISNNEKTIKTMTAAGYQKKYDDIVEQAILDEANEDIENATSQLEGAKAAALEAVSAQVSEILEALKNGASFDELIEKYSADPGSLAEPIKTNGYLVYTASSRWDDAFLDAVNSLENVGDISEPAVGKLGVYLVKYEAEAVAGPAALEDMRENVTELILSDRRSAALTECFNTWFEEADIQLVTE